MLPDHKAYRPDIDGLRAIAVLSVVIFHASSHALPGGFAGVDIFFVISGYLISGIILRQLQAGSFSLKTFYTRRVLRIFPPLILVLLFSWGLGWLVLLQSEYLQLGKHIAGGSGFIANILLWLESGYFDKAAETKPLLHLWSLGIEEQFYMLWPLLLMLVWKRRSNPGTLILSAIAIAISFACDLMLISEHAAAAFYLPHARFWELLAGSGLAYLQMFRSEQCAGYSTCLAAKLGLPQDLARQRDLASWAGIILLLIADLGLNKNMVYPGAWALFPVLGAVLLIAAGPEAVINRKLLARKGMVFIGLISYSLYLWHWPLLSFARIVESGKPATIIRVAAVLIAFVLAYLSYRLVERPMRFGTWRYRPQLAIGGMLAVLGVGLFISFSPTHTSRMPEFLAKPERSIPSPRHDPVCKKIYPVEGSYCLQSSDTRPVTTAIIGDSHANHLIPAVATQLEKHGEAVVHLGEPGCPPLIDGVRKMPGIAEDCRGINASVLDFLSQSNTIKRIIISFRGPLNVSGHGFGEIESKVTVGYLDAKNPLANQATAIHDTLARTISLLQEYGKEVWIFIEVPELGFHVDECTVRPFSIKHTKRTPCAVPLPATLERQKAYRQIILDIQKTHPGVRVFDPLPYLCDEHYCQGVIDGKALYVDGDHLSYDGSLYLSEKMDFFSKP